MVGSCLLEALVRILSIVLAFECRFLRMNLKEGPRCSEVARGLASTLGDRGSPGENLKFSVGTIVGVPSSWAEGVDSVRIGD